MRKLPMYTSIFTGLVLLGVSIVCSVIVLKWDFAIIVGASFIFNVIAQLISKRYAN